VNMYQSYVGSVKIPKGNFIYKLFRKGVHYSYVDASNSIC
jgi:hypothetical protein